MRKSARAPLLLIGSILLFGILLFTNSVLRYHIPEDPEKIKKHVKEYFKRKEAGFSSLTYLVKKNQKAYGNCFWIINPPGLEWLELDTCFNTPSTLTETNLIGYSDFKEIMQWLHVSTINSKKNGEIWFGISTALSRERLSRTCDIRFLYSETPVQTYFLNDRSWITNIQGNWYMEASRE